MKKKKEEGALSEGGYPPRPRRARKKGDFGILRPFQFTDAEGKGTEGYMILTSGLDDTLACQKWLEQNVQDYVKEGETQTFFIFQRKKEVVASIRTVTKVSFK